MKDMNSIMKYKLNDLFWHIFLAYMCKFYCLKLLLFLFNAFLPGASYYKRVSIIFWYLIFWLCFFPLLTIIIAVSYSIKWKLHFIQDFLIFKFTTLTSIQLITNFNTLIIYICDQICKMWDVRMAFPSLL